MSYDVAVIVVGMLGETFPWCMSILTSPLRLTSKLSGVWVACEHFPLSHHVNDAPARFGFLFSYTSCVYSK